MAMILWWTIINHFVLLFKNFYNQILDSNFKTQTMSAIYAIFESLAHFTDILINCQYLFW